MRFVRSRARGGFTLVETVFAIGILTIAALMLSAALSSSERMTSLARERAIANNVLRAYVERMRKSYPKVKGDYDMTELLYRGVVSGGTAGSNFTDGTTVPDSTPIYDLQKLYSNGFVERSVLKDAKVYVFWVTDETASAQAAAPFGAGGTTNWGPAVTASITNLSASGVASIDTSTFDSTLALQGVYTQMTTNDVTALGLPRDLNANGNQTDAKAANTDTFQKNSTDTTVLVPMKVQITWVSGSSPNVSSSSIRQSLTIYAILSPQH